MPRGKTVPTSRQPDAAHRRVGGMVIGPDFRLLRTLPRVPELLIWADNALLPTGHYREPTGDFFLFVYGWGTDVYSPGWQVTPRVRRSMCVSGRARRFDRLLLQRSGVPIFQRWWGKRLRWRRGRCFRRAHVFDIDVQPFNQ